jgi:hypothetical protein
MCKKSARLHQGGIVTENPGINFSVLNAC